MRCSIFIRIINFYKYKWFAKKQQPDLSTAVKIIPYQQHQLSLNAININASNVLKRLNKYGFDAYLVGGCIRDILLGTTAPKDFDIATNAKPEQIKSCFRNCRIIGRRFRLAHITFGREIIEVATFRGEHTDDKSHFSKKSESGMILRDNVYGTIEQDARRRDFTINALYYNGKDATIKDYCGGLEDLKKGIIRLIGDPETRYREDPVRMIRAIRFAAKLNMTIEAKTAEPIVRLRQLLQSIPSARLYDESLKLLQTGDGYKTYQLLREYQLFDILFPALKDRFTQEKETPLELMITTVLKNTDDRIKNDKRVNPAFLFAAILWYPLVEHTDILMQESGLSYHDAFALAIHDILSAQVHILAMPKRITSVIKDIWYLQQRLPRRTQKQVNIMLQHPKFRAGFDLLELRANIEKEKLQPLFNWWQEYLHAQPVVQQQMLKEQSQHTKRPRHFHSRGNKRKNQTPNEQ